MLTEELAQALEGASRSIVMPDMPPPQLVVEVVSPGQENTDRDYRYKRSQYQALKIAEYWIVDPIQKRITVLTLVSGLYEEAVFAGDDAIASALLSELGQESLLTVMQVLQDGKGKGGRVYLEEEDYEEDDFEEEDDMGWERDTYYDVELNTWMMGGFQPECNIPDRG